MILKELRINNFRSYCGESVFKFKKGLTLIIGGNGDGKTTFFDALDWLFTTASDNKSVSLISEKRKSELEVGESDILSVSLLFDHDGEKLLEKQFSFEKLEGGIISTKNFSFQGYDGIGFERVMVSGKLLLEARSGFDATMRKYCLFKGESELKVFDNETALKDLVEKFSDIKRLEKYVELASTFESKSEDAYKKEMGTDGKVLKKTKELDSKLDNVKRNISTITASIKLQEAEISVYQVKLDDMERHQDASEKYQAIKSRIASLEEKGSRIKHHTSEDYNIKLLDDFWILSPYPSIYDEFKKKVSLVSKEKRKLRETDIELKAKAKGKEEAIEEIKALTNGATQLPWYLPDDQTMQEMLDDQICKVCNREAIEGSDAYNFMKSKLENYLQENESKKTLEKQTEDQKPLFGNTHIEDMHNMSISLGGNNAKEIAILQTEIKERIEFIAARKLDLAKIEEQIKEANDEKNSLLIQNDDVSEALLDKNFKDMRGFFESKSHAENKILKLRLQLEGYKKEKREIDSEYKLLIPSKGFANLYSRIHIVLEKVENAFKGAKMINRRRFLFDLDERANFYLKKLNIDDFHGVVRIVETANESAKIQLYSSNGTQITSPNGALNTTVYMSVLFAISDLTTLKKEVDYPLIFDAPTSSFESFKENEFYNVIDKIDKQCIIVTKDLLEKDEMTGGRRLNEEKIKHLTCSVYRIEKKRPFTASDLSTICTTSIEIK